MKLSLFTPTNNVEWLSLPYNSIKQQLDLDSSLDIEWVLVPNSNAEIPESIRSEPWVKIYTLTEEIKTIGGLKKFACSKCVGDVFIEMDHDDELLPGSLRAIADSLAGKEVAFIFSDKYNVNTDGSDKLYSSYWGWEHYVHDKHEERWGRRTVNASFDINPRSLCEIFFAPDHFRAWTRKAYEITEGHDANLFVGDDHDLMIRTYLKGVEFIHLKEPYYVYHIHGTNSWLKHCDNVQKQQAANRDKYLRDLTAEWCRRNSLPTIGYYDIHKIEKNNSIGCIKITDELCSTPLGQPVIDLFNKAYDILASMGWLHIDVPSTDGRGAFCDPTHISFWNELSFRYYCDRNIAKFLPTAKCRFQQVVLHTHFPTNWYKEKNISYVRSDMCALKGQRQPGASLI